MVRSKVLNPSCLTAEEIPSNDLTTSNLTEARIFLQSQDDHGLELASTLDLEVHDLQHAPCDSWYLGCIRGALAVCHPTEPPLVISEHSVRSKIDDARNTHLAKACFARRGRSVLDAFGGWGIDGMALSVLGCDVTILEVNPIVCTMARYLAIELGCDVPVICGDVEQYLQATSNAFDVIYFDPMFPTHPKGAKPARRMQVLELLAYKNTDIQRVWELSKSKSSDRVVVKLRRTLPPLVLSSDWSISGKTVRFDVYRVPTL